MRTRLVLATPAALVALLALASTVLAGGWATVTATESSTVVTAGEATTVELTVRQHGQTPVGWPRLTVVATNAETREVVRSEARSVSAATGLYSATLVFPTAGTWTLAYESPDLAMEGSSTVAVDAGLAAAGSTAPATPGTGGPDSGILRAAFGATALLLLVAFALVIRNHRGDRRTDRPMEPIEPREQRLASGG